MPRPDHIARAYAVAPAEFTATRNRLAAELKKNGRAAEARALVQLRKPSAPLWAANRLASTDGKSLAAFFDAVERVRETQLRDPRRAADVLQAQRGALDRLVAHGRQILADAGLTVSQQALRRLSDTLMGAAVDREHAETLRRGELTEELSAPGFEAFSGVRVPERPRLRLVRSPTVPAKPAGDREAVTARAEAERRRRQEAEDLARRAIAQARAVSDLEAERVSARARVADLDRKLRAARREAKQAATAARRARGKAGST